MDTESKIKERIQERYGIMEALYTAWFTNNNSSLVPKDKFYQQEHIEKHRAIAYLLDKGYIIAHPVENEPETVAVSITSEGIDFYEQGFLSGKANGWSVVTEHKDDKMR